MIRKLTASSKIYSVVGQTDDHQIIAIYYGDSEQSAHSWFDTYCSNKEERGFVSVHLLEEILQG